MQGEGGVPAADGAVLDVAAEDAAKASTFHPTQKAADGGEDEDEDTVPGGRCMVCIVARAHGCGTNTASERCTRRIELERSGLAVPEGIPPLERAEVAEAAVAETSGRIPPFDDDVEPSKGALDIVARMVVEAQPELGPVLEALADRQEPPRAPVKIAPPAPPRPEGLKTLDLRVASRSAVLTAVKASAAGDATKDFDRGLEPPEHLRDAAKALANEASKARKVFKRKHGGAHPARRPKKVEPKLEVNFS